MNGPECPRCGHPTIKINLQIDGVDLVMLSCSECDSRSWHRGGRPVELAGVLADLSSTDTRYRRDLANR